MSASKRKSSPKVVCLDIERQQRRKRSSPITEDCRDSPPATDEHSIDTTARERIRTSLNESLIVEAAAGTGKTSELVQRLVAVLELGETTVDRIVAVTFTRKAAGELKLRLRQELDRARRNSEETVAQNRLQVAVSRLEEAHVGTIHSFCAEMLRERPVEARVDPAFTEIDQEEAGRLYERAFRSWIESKLEEMPPGLARSLSRLAVQRRSDGASPIDRLREAGRSLLEWRDFPTPWRRKRFDRESALDTLAAAVAELAAVCRCARSRADALCKAIQPAEALAAWLRRSEEACGNRDYDALEARFIELFAELKRHAKRTGSGQWFAEGIERKRVMADRDALIAGLEDFKRCADADLAAVLRSELWEVVEEYERIKQRVGKLDFRDLLMQARDLLRDSDDVRGFFQTRFTHLFVDEFHDTDPLQAEILLLLSSSDPNARDWLSVRPLPGKLFLVGDPKQSIYRFRRADVLLYQQIKERLVAAGVGLVLLTRSFRANETVQEIVNSAFGPQMTGDPVSGQPEYVRLNKHRAPIEGQPAVIALPIPEPYGYRGLTKWQLEEGQPDLIGAFVTWLIEDSGWQVEDPEQAGRKVAIQPRHVAILFRRFIAWGKDVTRRYLGTLEARGVPHLLSGGRTFHQREEVETVRAALTAIEWPDDELSVFATLKGSLFAVPDSLLLRFRCEVGGLHPFGRHTSEIAADFAPIVEALGVLARLHRRRNRVPIVQTINGLLAATRAHAGFALRPAGNQVLANVQRICDRARGFELRGGLSFRGFVERLSDEAQQPSSTEAPIVEEAAEGVRIMTTHAAKGLEFPVVVLADITANLSRAVPERFVDSTSGLCASSLLGCLPWEVQDNAVLELERDRAEGVRVAYVAATRARDLLVIPTVGDGPWEGGWVSPLNPALYPPRQRFRRSQPAPGCPVFGEATVLQRPQRAHGEEERSVRPGLHRSAAGNQVVWWDPSTLRLQVEASFGLRQEQILTPDPSGETVAEGERRYREWQMATRQALSRGSLPQFEVTAVTEIASPGVPEKASPLPAPEGGLEAVAKKTVTPSAGVRIDAVRAPSTEHVGADQPVGRRYGTLVHTILRDVDLEARHREIRELAQLHGRSLGAMPREVEIAALRI